VQLLPTSPFITAKEIQDFVYAIGNNDTLVSVRDNQIECIYKNKPVNFDLKLPTPPSQELEPIKSYACVLMGWKRDAYLHNMSHYGCAYHGGDGIIGYFTLKGFSEIDIDNEEDFSMAEAVWSYLNAD
jgi:CMP-N-acetylneuraminic acid synthetase